MTDHKDGRRRPEGYRGALPTYLKSIRRYQFLTTSGEFRLLSRRDGGDSTRKDLVEANLRFVVKLARQYRFCGAPLEDLISEGNIGLMEAARRFDPSRGVRFSSYAAWWIRKYMVSALNRYQAQASSPAAAPAVESGAGARGAEPDAPTEAADAHHRPPRQKHLSFDEFVRQDGDRDIVEKLAAPENTDPDDRILRKELADAVRSVLPALSRQEQQILTAHYGLDGNPAQTLQQIGRALGCTRERVRQLEVKALARVRRLVAQKFRHR